MLKISLYLPLFFCISLFSQGIEYAKHVVSELSSEEYSGRAYLEKGDQKAAEFIKMEFVKYGIKPLGKNFFQPFIISVNTFPGKIESSLNGTLLKPGADFLVDPSSPTVKDKFIINSFSRADLLNQDTLKKIINSSNGNAILIDETDTLTFSKEELTKIDQIINTIKYAAELKNSLTIIYTNKKLTWSISPWQAKKSVITVLSKGIQSKDYTQIEINIEAKFLKKYSTQNICGIIEGTICRDSFLVLTAHYDHLGKMGKETIFPGANDNASGVAMLLNLSRHFALNPPKYSIVFIAFSAEELGLLGSEYFTKSPLIDLQKIKFLINFDLAGTGEEGIKVVNSTIFQSEFQRLKQINLENNYLNAIEPRGEACISDHCFFYKQNVPSFYMYTLGGVKAYHDIYDKAETLPMTQFVNYSELMKAFITSF